MANTELPIPQGVVAGKYRLTRLLGRGGMGAVWEGTHVSLGTRVAVKFIDAEYAQSAEARSRFENEARAAARLRSKHVVEVYDHGVSEDSRPFIVMEFLGGEPLDKRLDRVGRLPAKETAHLVMQVCRALTKAHAAHIVHRDLKPENVFLVWDEEDGTDVVKVVDFGIAKFSDANASSSATRTGSLLGTPHYMSPEQARGLRSVDFRSDLWSVAVIAYRCIVGSLPFEGEAVGDLLVKLCTAPIPQPSQFAPYVPPGFDAWLHKALRREPNERFASAAELADSLAAVCGLSVRSPMPSAELPRSPDLRGTGQDPLGTGPQRAAVGASSGSFSQARSAGLATGAPTSRTASQLARTGRGAVIAASLVTLVVLGIAAAVAVKLLSSRASSAALPAGTAPSVTLAAPVVPATSVAQPNVAPVAPSLPVEPASASSAPQTPPSAVPPSAKAAVKAPVAPRPVTMKPLDKPPIVKPNPAGSDIGF